MEPRAAINPGEDRCRPIPEWTLGFDPTRNSWFPVPLDPALTPQDAHHEVAGSPLNPKPGWDWKYDRDENRYRAIALRPKTPIPEWTRRVDPKTFAETPVPVDPRLTAEEAYHAEYGTPLSPAPGWDWPFNATTQRFVPAISDAPSRYGPRRLYRWHPDDGYYSLVREDDDDGDDNLYEYDSEWLVFRPVIIVYQYDAMTNQPVRVAKPITGHPK